VLLRWHVGRRADHRARARDRRLRAVAGVAVEDRLVEHRAREPEVGDARAAVIADQHVVGLEVAVHDAGGVRGGEPFARGAVEPEDLVRRARPARQPRARGAAGDVLHRDEHAAVDLADLVHDDDVRVRDARQRPRLALDAGERVRGPRVAELDRDVAIEPQIAREVDDAHPAGTDRPDHAVLVLGDQLAGVQHRPDRHRRCIGQRVQQRRGGAEVIRRGVRAHLRMIRDPHADPPCAACGGPVAWHDA
jgi:hypothetical protein